MIKTESIEPLFQNLRNILINKQCKTEIKSEIIVTFMTLCNLNTIDSYELENLLHNIVEGLKNVEEIEIDTRENLCKVPKIKENLKLSTGGYVTFSRKKLVVVKENFYNILLVHELIHLTQERDAYHLPNKYDYVTIVKKALEEGEASYYQAMYTKENVPSLVEKNYYHKNLINRKDYNIFLEFYQDMRTLLGMEVMEKWKSISKNDDFMLEIEIYMQEHYQCSIASIYQIWCVILYHYMNEVAKNSEEDEKEYSEELHYAKKYHKQNMEEFNYLYELLIQSLSSYPEYLKDLEEEIKEYSVALSSPEKLENSMFQFIKNENQELREYIKENGYDDVVEEWKKDLGEINIHTYKEAILNWKKSDENDYNSCLQSQQEKSLEKQKLEYHKTFIVDSTLETMPIEELENLKNQQLAYLLQRKKQIESNKLGDSVNKHM